MDTMSRKVDRDALYEEIKQLVLTAPDIESDVPGTRLVKEARWARVCNVLFGYPADYDGS